MRTSEAGKTPSAAMWPPPHGDGSLWARNVFPPSPSPAHPPPSHLIHYQVIVTLVFLTVLRRTKRTQLQSCPCLHTDARPSPCLNSTQLMPQTSLSGGALTHPQPPHSLPTPDSLPLLYSLLWLPLPSGGTPGPSFIPRWQT